MKVACSMGHCGESSPAVGFGDSHAYLQRNQSSSLTSIKVMFPDQLISCRKLELAPSILFTELQSGLKISRGLPKQSYYFVGCNIVQEKHDILCFWDFIQSFLYDVIFHQMLLRLGRLRVTIVRAKDTKPYHTLRVPRSKRDLHETISTAVNVRRYTNVRYAAGSKC